MTKKLFGLLLAAALLFGSAGCSSFVSELESPAENSTAQETQGSALPQTDPESSSASDASEDAQEQTQPTAGSAGSKLLVVYFSRTGEQYAVGDIAKGNTAIVAELIAAQTGADLFEVAPADDYYPRTYNELTDVAKKEQNDNARPEYAGQLPDLSQYDTIFIGAPVWWGDWPMIMYTVFESNDFSGKRLVPFSTHEGSGLSGFDRRLASACPDAEVLEGLAIRGNDAQNRPDSVQSSVNDWLSGLGY